MFCSNCGCKIQETDIFCPECGQKIEQINTENNQSVQKDEQETQAYELAKTPAVPEIHIQTSSDSGTDTPLPCEKTGKGVAIAAYILGFASIIYGWLLPVPIVGIILGKKGENSDKPGMAKTGFTLSLIFMIIWLVVVSFILLAVLGIVAASV